LVVAAALVVVHQQQVPVPVLQPPLLCPQEVPQTVVLVAARLVEPVLVVMLMVRQELPAVLRQKRLLSVWPAHLQSELLSQLR
jgi:hypothetical protein